MTTITTEKIDVDQLANEIRRVDGAHSLGAGALAEALMPFITRAIAERAMVPQPQGQALPENKDAALADLLKAADEYATAYDGDERDCIKTDVLNAFYQGAHYASKQALEPQGKDQRWKLTDEDGSVSYTDRWDVAKHHPNAQPQGQALPELPEDQVRFNLKAMASNYPDGHNWDKLDADVCMRAYEEITALREHIKATASQLALPAGPVPTDAEFDALRAAAIEACTWLDHANCVNLPVDDVDPDTSMRASMNELRDLAWKLSRRSASPSPAVAQPVCQTCSDQGEVYVVNHEGELPSHDLAPCPDCTKTVAQHSDDIAVDRFAAAMKEKLKLAREKGRGGWEQCSQAVLSRMLREHVEKGDPRDVANFCMMLWNNGVGVAAVSPAVAQPVADEREAFEYAARKLQVYSCHFERFTADEAERFNAQEEKVGNLRRVSEGDYRSNVLRDSWKVWQARAALCPPAEEGGKS